MSNPLINRWGLNLFWYKFWFTDKNYYLTMQQDSVISQLVYIFLNYGILLPKNTFLAKYWFYRKFSFKNYFTYHNTKYYRVVNFKNTTTNVNSFFFNRTDIKNVYNGKLWILRYQHWLVINYYCFKPLKTKNFKKTTNSSIFFKKSLYLEPTKSKNLLYTRLFFFFNFLQIQQNNFSYYKF